MQHGRYCQEDQELTAIMLFLSTSITNPVYRTSTSESQPEKVLVSFFLLSVKMQKKKKKKNSSSKIQ